MAERNIELAEKTMQYIKDHPEEHDQSVWWCGTTGCFAGHALSLAGRNVQAMVMAWPMDAIPSKAQEALGMTHDERRVVFSSVNTIPMLELMVKDFVNGDEIRKLHEYADEAER